MALHRIASCALLATAYAGVSPSMSAPCPCSNPSLCAPIHVAPRKEVFGFQVTPSNWPYYRWDAAGLTTVCAAGGLDPDMLCHAHANQVKVSVIVGFPVAQLQNETFIQAFIDQQIAAAQAGFYDGINFDVEDPLTLEQAPALTAVVNRTAIAMKAAIVPDFQISVDVAWSPNCIDERCYDYASLCSAADLCFVMAYDMRSQVFWPAPCIASANSPLPLVASGLTNFTSLSIPADKLILGVPWYGYTYTCIDDPAPDQNVCTIQRVTWRGVNCSDAVGSEIDYSYVNSLIANNATRAVAWNDTLSAPFFDYVDATTGAVHQVWFDNPRSLSAKFALAASMGLRGVGTWELDALDYTSSDPIIRNQTAAMWDAFGVFSRGT